LSATTPPAPQPAVITVVRVPTPWYAPAWLVTRKMRGTLAQYDRIDGLLFKAYAHSTDRHFGGVYFWRDRASADAWFSPAWHQRVRDQYGMPGNVRRFTILHGAAQWPRTTDTHANAVAVLTLASADRSESQPSPTGDLLAWYAVRDEQGRAATLTLWRTQQAAQRGLSTLASSSAQEWFQCPILLPSVTLAQRNARAAQP
jgi:hypothetical protein